MSKPASDASFKVVEQMKRRHGLGGRRIRAVSYGMTPEPPTPQPAPSPSLKRHELSELFGPMDPATYADLVADVRARGRLDHPVVLHEDRVIDGWHRYLACLEANVEPKFVQWADIDNGGDPLDFVIRANKLRRHMSPSRLAWLGAKLACLRPGQRPNPQNCVLTQAAVAARLGVSTRTLQMANRVFDKAKTPEIGQAIEAERLSISAAERIVNQHRSADAQRAAVQESTTTKRARAATAGNRRKPRRRVSAHDKSWQLLGPALDLIEQLEESLDLIEQLGKFSEKTIAEGAAKKNADPATRLRNAGERLLRIANALPGQRAPRKH